MLRGQPEENAALIFVLRKGADWLARTIRCSATSFYSGKGAESGLSGSKRPGGKPPP